MPLTPGTRLGPYEIQSQLGAGGMGEVYQARDTRLDRDVALKVLSEAFTSDPDRLARFERTADLGIRDAAGKWYAATSHAEIVVSLIVSSERRRIVSLFISAGIVAAVVCVSAVHGLPAVGGPAAASSASSEASAQADSERARVVGTYQIVGRRTKDADGNWQAVEGFNSVGYITYSDTGHMGVNVMPKGRTPFADTQPTPEEAQTALQGYSAYYGPFSTHEDEDGKYLVHHRLATINPSGELDAKRYYHFEGDRLILTPAAGDGSKTQATRQVVWQRLPDVELSEEAKRFVGFRQLLYTDRYSERDGQLVSHDQRNEGRAGSYIIYTPTGHMMVHLTPREGRARYAGATPTPDEALEAYQTYGGYFGTFTVYENADLPYVVHHQEGRSRPSEPTDGVRLYQLDGDVLRLGGRPRVEDGVATGGHLYWELMPPRPE